MWETFVFFDHHYKDHVLNAKIDRPSLQGFFWKGCYTLNQNTITRIWCDLAIFINISDGKFAKIVCKKQ